MTARRLPTNGHLARIATGKRLSAVQTKQEAPTRAAKAKGASEEGGKPRKRAQQRATASPVLAAMTEAAFQRAVKSALVARGFTVWTFPIMKRTVAGVPDLIFWGPRRPGLLYFWELKTERGRVRPEQAVAIAHLAGVPGVDARIVRPSQWDELRKGLDR